MDNHKAVINRAGGELENVYSSRRIESWNASLQDEPRNVAVENVAVSGFQLVKVLADVRPDSSPRQCGTRKETMLRVMIARGFVPPQDSRLAALTPTHSPKIGFRFKGTTPLTKRLSHGFGKHDGNSGGGWLGEFSRTAIQ